MLFDNFIVASIMVVQFFISVFQYCHPTLLIMYKLRKLSKFEQVTLFELNQLTIFVHVNNHIG